MKVFLLLAFAGLCYSGHVEDLDPIKLESAALLLARYIDALPDFGLAADGDELIRNATSNYCYCPLTPLSAGSPRNFTGVLNMAIHALGGHKKKTHKHLDQSIHTVQQAILNGGKVVGASHRITIQAEDGELHHVDTEMKLPDSLADAQATGAQQNHVTAEAVPPSLQDNGVPYMDHGVSAQHNLNHAPQYQLHPVHAFINAIAQQSPVSNGFPAAQMQMQIHSQLPGFGQSFSAQVPNGFHSNHNPIQAAPLPPLHSMINPQQPVSMGIHPAHLMQIITGGNTAGGGGPANIKHTPLVPFSTFFPSTQSAPHPMYGTQPSHMVQHMGSNMPIGVR